VLYVGGGVINAEATAELMALAEARFLHEDFELFIAIPDGPLRSAFAPYGMLVGGTATVPLWGASAPRWASRAVRTLRDALRLARVIRRTGVQLVLTNSAVSVAPVLGARLAGVPAVVHVRDVPASALSRAVFALHGALADTVIVIAGELERLFAGARRARVVHIREGVRVPTAPADARLRTPDDALDLCLVGGIDPRKGHDVAIDALASLRRRGIRARLEVVGREVDAAFAAGLREQAARLGVGDAVRYAGELDDVTAALARADVVIAPSRAEWTPLSLMEAMAHRRPVVAAAVGAVADVMAAGGPVGLLTPPGDAQALAGAVAQLAGDPRAAREMGRRGRSHVAQRFDIERSLRALRDELERVLPPAPGRCPGSPSGS
jgi:glycosyltransferase involved in cell wall biosynthesis